MAGLLDEAQGDIRQVEAWYDAQVRGLGERVLDDVQRALEEIDAFPDSAPIWEHPTLNTAVRRATLRTFPYAVYYVTAPQLVVIAVSHKARDPGHWLGRLHR